MRASPSRRAVWLGFLVYPGHTLPTAAAPLLVAAGLAYHDGVLQPVPLLLAFLGSWFIHLAGVFADQYELVRRFPGLPEHPELLEALKRGALSLRQLRMAIGLCLALAALTAPFFILRGGAVAAGIGLVGVVASLSYAAGPLRYARLGLADPVFFAMFGIVAVAGAYYAQAGAFAADAFLVGLPVGALVTNVLVIDDVRDHAFDAQKCWRTGAVRFGLRWARAEYALLSIFAYAAPFWLWLGRGFSAWSLLALATLPLTAPIARAVCREERREALVPMTPRASLLSLVFAALLALGIAA